MDKPEMTPPTAFPELARLCEGLASTTKRLEKIALIAEFLKGLKEEEIVPASLFLSGRVFSESDPRVLEVGFALRFARITRVREDKGPEDIDTLAELRRLQG